MTSTACCAVVGSLAAHVNRCVYLGVPVRRTNGGVDNCVWVYVPGPLCKGHHISMPAAFPQPSWVESPALQLHAASSNWVIVLQWHTSWDSSH
jgi:hypothetical protein